MDQRVKCDGAWALASTELGGNTGATSVQMHPFRGSRSESVRDEVLRRGRGFCHAKKLGARINPGESVRQMFTLQSVERYDGRKLGAYDVSHMR